MMQLPDCTLFLQMIHFVIAYWTLNKFVFAPSLQILEKQKTQEQADDFKVSHLKSEKQKLMLSLKNQWQLIKQALLQNMPENNRACKFKHLEPMVLDQQSLSPEQKSLIKKSIKQHISENL